jgi:hypothetical protein
LTNTGQKKPTEMDFRRGLHRMCFVLAGLWLALILYLIVADHTNPIGPPWLMFGVIPLVLLCVIGIAIAWALRGLGHSGR